MLGRFWVYLCAGKVIKKMKSLDRPNPRRPEMPTLRLPLRDKEILVLKRAVEATVRPTPTQVSKRGRNNASGE